MSIYMQYGGIGGGPTTAPGRAFEIKDFSFDVENPTTIGSATGGAGAGKTKFNEFSIGKKVDSGPPVFRRHQIIVTKPTDVWSHGLSLQRRKLDVSIVFVNPSGSRHTLNLSGAVITDIKPSSVQHSGNGELTRYEKLTLVFSEYDFNGLPNAPIHLGFLRPQPL
jgi:hypothetical protein